MTETEDSKPAGGVKTILECVALVLTIVGTVVGIWSTRGGSDPPADDATSVATADQTSADTSEVASRTPPSRPAARIPAQTVSTSVPRNAVAEALDAAATDAERAERLHTVFESYPASVLTPTVASFDYDAFSEAVQLRVVVSVDVAGYEALSEQIAAGLGDSAGVFTATLDGQESKASLQLDRPGTAFLQPVAEAKQRRGQEVIPKSLVLVRATADDPRDGQELIAAGWQLTPTTAAPFVEAIDQGLTASVRVVLKDAAGGILATITRPLATPRDGTWDAARFVHPLMPAGHAWSLEKGLITPSPAMRDWHREDSAGRNVVTMLPGVLSPAERAVDQKLASDRPLLREVTYTFNVPLSAAEASRIAMAAATIVSGQ